MTARIGRVPGQKCVRVVLIDEFIQVYVEHRLGLGLCYGKSLVHRLHSGFDLLVPVGANTCCARPTLVRSGGFLAAGIHRLDRICYLPKLNSNLTLREFPECVETALNR